MTEPVADRLGYSDEAVRRAIHLTSAHPFLLQNLCNRVFDLSAREERRSVTVDTVDRAADELVDDNEHFAAEWQALHCHHHRSPNPPETPPTLGETMHMVAKLGGFLGRTCDGGGSWRSTASLPTSIRATARSWRAS